MDPNQSISQTDSVQAPEQNPQDKLTTKVTDSAKEFTKNHYEGFARSMMNTTLTMLGYIKSGVISIINQVLSKD